MNLTSSNCLLQTGRGGREGVKWWWTFEVVVMVVSGTVLSGE